jgi:hypothetical protein
VAKPLNLVWTKNLPSTKKKEFEATLRNSTFVLSRLRDILDEEMEVLDRQETTISDFDHPNWSHKQAYRNGERARIRKMRDLLSFF